jgi:hypothetical protein
MELFHLNSDTDTEESISDDEEEECIMAVQDDHSSENTTKKQRTMRFRGWIGKQEILILLDSGSVGTFISDKVAQQCLSQLQSCEPMQFTTANGTNMVSDEFIRNFQWFIQEHSFSYDARVLPLKCFDRIMGADWLEDHSLTWIHWKKKLMKFPMNGKRLFLQGIKDNTSSCKSISVRKLKGLLRRSSVSHCIELRPISRKQVAPPVHSISEACLPDDIEQDMPQPLKEVVLQYKHLFQESIDLPPFREGDHHIPLLSGAQPVNIRPYKYAPQQIEKKITDMLKRGVIQHSVSPFASLVLLVKKKDGTWRFL